MKALTGIALLYITQVRPTVNVVQCYQHNVMFYRNASNNQLVN